VTWFLATGASSQVSPTVYISTPFYEAVEGENPVPHVGLVSFFGDDVIPHAYLFESQLDGNHIFWSLSPQSRTMPRFNVGHDRQYGSFRSLLRKSAWIAIIVVALSLLNAATVSADNSDDSTGVSKLYTSNDTNVVILSTVTQAKDVILASSFIWMIQFYNPDSVKSQEFAETFKNLGKVCHGIFSLAVVDIATDEGKAIAKALQLPQSRIDKEDAATSSDKTTSTTPWIYTMTPSPFDNTQSKLLNVKIKPGLVGLEAIGSLLEPVLKEQNFIFTKRSIALGLAPKDEKDQRRQGGGGSGSSKTSGGNHVVELTADNFDRYVYQNPNVVAVAFTAPWCGHCTNLKPEWDQAAASLAKQGVTLGWLDATVHTDLASLYQVKGFPTIKVFPGGSVKTPKMAKDYPGGRTATSIVQYLLDEVDRTGVPQEIPQLTNSSIWKDSCSGGGTICVLAVLPHILESGAAGRNKYRDMLSSVAKEFRGGSVFVFLWWEAGAQVSLEQGLELTFGAPALVAYSMDKHVYAVMRSAFATKSITAFLHGISTGRQRTVPLQQGASLAIVDTQPWDGLDGAPIEDELSLEDIMGDEL
jgi:protein disulfide-isomerase-like protein